MSLASGRVRLSLDIRQVDEDEMAATEELDLSPSRTEMLRRAVKVLHAIRKHQKKGGKIVFQDADGSRETLMIL